MFGTIIRQGYITDGTGKKGFVGDVALERDEIVAIAPHITTAGHSEIDATGKVIAPGFIDIQNHSDAFWQLFEHPELTSLTAQGFTTILLGTCGASLAPLLSHEALLAFQKWRTVDGVNVNWKTFSEFASHFGKERFGVNVGSLVGLNTIRRGIAGNDIHPFSADEFLALTHQVSESLAAGAFGVSTGLSYAHEAKASLLELAEIARIVHDAGRLLSVHIRNEGSGVTASVEEVLDIIRHTGVNTVLSHFKFRGKESWPALHDTLEAIEYASHQSLPIHFNVYPYDTVWQVLYRYLPSWAIVGGREAVLQHVRDAASHKKILSYLNDQHLPADHIIISGTGKRLNVVGKTLREVAHNLDMSVEQAILELIDNGGSDVMVFDPALDPEQVSTLLSHPLSCVATDGAGFPLEADFQSYTSHTLVHPRCFGTAPRFLNWALKKHGMSSEEAVYKLTGLPASIMGIKDRGTLVVGNKADIVVFNPDMVMDKATLQNPYQTPIGIEHVLVNGESTVTASKSTKGLFGRFLRK
jgi:N-acyl-D-amino-acid deacylase